MATLDGGVKSLLSQAVTHCPSLKAFIVLHSALLMNRDGNSCVKNEKKI